MPKDSSAIAQGDAITLIGIGIKNNLFETFDSNSYENITGYLATLSGTVFDLYAYHNELQTSDIVNK